ncbi:hypothetical protein G4H71_10230 [Rhodococcus triatomae]|uniref:Uncharacterized protein n=1 Tax=Rhodococcus triatomae TaxID=300028 RepID=A0A1G8SD45_9NOCA|nr:hypothetical protein [Rhodococcus triatomae]QNG20721.1 hypothetical protein G4H72_20150 [Rhodococcus triatomae]QNG23361.1 hypothetical protein G4H71_10230 [Rhodococcus triatomae]SDJ27138.1 hypothetical protein SAMN05444695_1217 [Rhodococcus triatomae]
MMTKRALATAALLLGGVFGATPTAAAQPDSTGPFDVTERFVAPWDPGAFAERSAYPLILSPHGTAAPIWCHVFRGEVFHCVQHGPDGPHGVWRVTPAEGPLAGLRPVFAFNPFDPVR